MNRTEALRLAETRYEEHPTDANYAQMLAAYGTMYFSPTTAKEGAALLAADRVSALSFEKILPVLSRNSESINFVQNLKSIGVPKLFLTGEDEVIFTPWSLAGDAREAGCHFEVVRNASHFVTFDQPEAVAGLIESVFSTAKK